MTDRINLLSDTATRPSPAMRRAIAEAPVGDEQRKEDPTVNRLCELVARTLGKEAAVFLPSATMANQAAFAVHCRGGEEILGHRLSHPFNHEAGSAAYLARAMIRPLEGERGMFTSEALGAVLRPASYRSQRQALLLVENTTNTGGGAVWPMEQIRAVTETAKRSGLACHMDGSRLMNAVVASGRPAVEFSAPFDSVTLCFSKGLGAPVGAALAGSAEFIDKAWLYKNIFGGAMRQAGIIAAAALYGLEHNVDRLAEDHANAKRLAKCLAVLPGIELDPEQVETNIVVFRFGSDRMTLDQLRKRMAELGVDFGPVGPGLGRLVTHLDVDSGMIDRAIECFRSVLA